MKVFVTGATGAIGRFAVPALIAAGHEVDGLARSEEKAAQLEAQGARAVRVSLFDEAALKDAFAGQDAVCNLATAIPPMTKAANASSWADNERIRRDGSGAVVNAALGAGVQRLVQESITFTYPDCGDRLIDESVERDTGFFGASVAVAEGNTQRFTEEGGIGVVLRFGMFYGPHSHHTDQFLAAARRHIGPVVGSKKAYQSLIHLEDAASAVVAALTAPAGIYNVAEDEPLTKKQGAKALGSAMGKRPWLYLPGVFVRLSGQKASVLTRSQRISSARFKAASGWSPRYPSPREGWKAVVDAA